MDLAPKRPASKLHVSCWSRPLLDSRANDPKPWLGLSIHRKAKETREIHSWLHLCSETPKCADSLYVLSRCLLSVTKTLTVMCHDLFLLSRIEDVPWLCHKTMPTLHMALFWVRSKKNTARCVMALLVSSKRETQSSMFVLLVRKIRGVIPMALQLFARKHLCSISCCLARVSEPREGIKPTAVDLDLLPSNCLLRGFTSKT